MTRGPDFEELVDGLPDEERDRLRRVHEVLLAVGPPPELPPTLTAEVPGLPRTRERPPLFTTLPRRRLAAALTGALGIAAAAFGFGYLLGADEEPRLRTAGTVHTLQMKSTGVQPDVVGVLRIAKEEEGGNTPLVLAVSGLRDLGRSGHYELWLTRNGKRVVSCGTFVAETRDLVVQLNAPYTLEEFAAWEVVEDLDERAKDPAILTTEPASA